MSTIPAPPVGARVRHTSIYADSTVIAVEGTVARLNQHGAVIGAGESAHICALEDQPGVFTVALEVLAPPLRPEPPSGSVAASTYTVWLRGHGGWFDGHEPDAGREFLTWTQLNARHPDVRVLCYDPADSAPELPYAVCDGDIRVDVERVGAEVELRVTAGTLSVRPRLDHEHAPKVAAAILRAAREARQA